MSYPISDLGNISEILPGKLFLSGFTKANELELLRKNNIKTIVNCALNLANTLEKYEEFTHHNLNLLDSLTEPIEKKFDESFQIIDNAKDAVLVHCQMGMSRAPTIVIAYLMRKNKMRYEDANKFVRKRRPCAWPNYSFVQKLKEFEKEIFLEDGNDRKEIVKCSEGESKVKSKCCVLL